MPANFTADEVKTVIDFVKSRPYMTHAAASWCLQRRGMQVSLSGIQGIRKRYEIPFSQDRATQNIVVWAIKKGIKVDNDFLIEKCPHICQEYRDYLLHHYVDEPNKCAKPVPVNTMAFWVQQLTANDDGRQVA